VRRLEFRDGNRADVRLEIQRREFAISLHRFCTAPPVGTILHVAVKQRRNVDALGI
jgi:hypothetical protein